MVEVKLPPLSEDTTMATITLWHYTEGDTVRRDDDLVEFVTDKATFNLPSPATGRVKKVLFNEGETVSVGDTIALIE